MGLFVRLAIKPDRIAPGQWREVYEESLALLQGYPGEMMGHESVITDSGEKALHTKNLEHHPDDPVQRHWHVVGDWGSKQHCESFIFYYDLAHYRSKERTPQSRDNKADDILVSMVERKQDVAYVLFNKTDRQPYHIPMLAVAMLVEDRFPTYAHVHGDINFDEARRAQALAKSILKRLITLPLIVSASRLLERLQQHYPRQEAVTHFHDFFYGEYTETVERLLQGEPQNRLL